MDNCGRIIYIATILETKDKIYLKMINLIAEIMI